MTWASLVQFVQMGGHGLYVCGAYGIAFAAILAEVISLARR